MAPVAASALQRRLGDDEEAEQLVTSGPQVCMVAGRIAHESQRLRVRDGTRIVLYGLGIQADACIMYYTVLK